MAVVFHRPVNRVAGQSVLAGKCGNAAVFHPAQAALGLGPERTIPIGLKAVDTAVAQTIFARVGRADLAVLEIRYATLVKAEP
jgi:hypothetical protein